MSRTIDELIAGHLAERGERKVDLAAFDYMLREGRILLLFDGFDELLSRTTFARAADRVATLSNARAVTRPTMTPSSSAPIAAPHCQSAVC